jgi:preprotein translocase subunit YajC
MMNVFWTLFLPLAQESASSEELVPPQQETPYQFFIMLAVIFGIVYFLILRPQAKQETDRKSMVDTLQKNDRVVTNGGIIGIVISVKGEEVVLRVDDKKDIKLHFIKSAIAGTFEQMKQDAASGTPSAIETSTKA